MQNEQLIWLILGLCLIAVEIFSGTIALLFMGIGALALAGLGYFLEVPIWAEIIIFGLISWFGFYFFWKKRKQAADNGESYINDVDQTVQLSSAIAGHAQTYINYQGSQWLATNESSENLAAGETARIVRTEGNRLIVTKK